MQKRPCKYQRGAWSSRQPNAKEERENIRYLLQGVEEERDEVWAQLQEMQGQRQQKARGLYA